MITYVNTVLVSNNGGTLATNEEVESWDLSAVGKIVFMNLDDADADDSQSDVYAVPQSGVVNKFKLGVITDKYITKKDGTKAPIIKWSNEIKTADIKNIAKLTHPGEERTEDTITIDFSKKFPSQLATRGGFPIVLRLTFSGFEG